MAKVSEADTKSLGAILRNTYSDGIFESDVGLGVFKTGFPTLDYGLGFPVDVYKGSEWVRRDIHKGILMGSYFMIVGDSGTGKALSVSAQIPTPEGYTTMGELRIGDYVVDLHGNPTKVLGVYDQGEQDLYLVNLLDGRSVECTLDHLWFVKEYNSVDDTWIHKVVTTKEMISKLEFGHKYYLPRGERVNYTEQPVPIDPKTLAYAICYCNFNRDMLTMNLPLSAMAEYIYKTCGYDYSVSPDGEYIFNIGTKDFFKDVPSVLTTKGNTIPSMYMFNSLSVRKNMYRTIMDYYVRNSSIDRNQLLSELMYLGRSMGYQMSIKHDIHGNPRPGRRCHANRITNIQFSRKGEARCIKVDNEDELYMCEDFIPTHNTTIGVQIASNIIRQYEYGLVYHFDLERASVLSHVMDISRLPRKDFDVTNPEYRYILSQAPADHETIQKVIFRLYKEKMSNPGKYTIKLDQYTEYGDPIVTMQPTVVLIDSIPMIGNILELGDSKDEKKMEQSLTQMDAAQTAGAFKRMMKMILGPMKQANIIVIGMSHLGVKIASNPMIHNKKDFRGLGQDEIIAGGKMNTYGATNIIKTERRSGKGYTIENGDGFNGFDSLITVVKSRTTFDAKVIPMIYDCNNGFDSIRSMIQYGIDRGVIIGNRANMKFTSDPECKFNYTKLYTEIKEKPQILQNISRYIIKDLESGFRVESEPESLMNVFLDY